MNIQTQSSYGGRPPVDYSQWSIEELWELASQLRVAGARNKSRRELLELFAVPASAQRARS
jgi:hypothetical protein